MYTDGHKNLEELILDIILDIETLKIYFFIYLNIYLGFQKISGVIFREMDALMF